MTDKEKVIQALNQAHYSPEILESEVSIYLPYSNPFPCKLTFFFNNNNELILIKEVD